MSGVTNENREQTVPLELVGLPLIGHHLIEASAGTGKTFTLAALYVRLVLGPLPGRETVTAIGVALGQATSGGGRRSLGIVPSRSR